MSSVINPLQQEVNDYFNSSVASLRGIQAYDGKVISIAGNYYQYQLIRSTSTNAQGVVTPESYYIPSPSTAFTAMKNALTGYQYFFDVDQATSQSFGCTGIVYYNKLVLRALSSSLSITVNFTSSANKLAAQPYCMATFPYGGYIRYWNVGIDPYINKELALNLASAISEALGSYVVDIQLLPFCPVQERILPLSPHGTQ